MSQRIGQKARSCVPTVGDPRAPMGVATRREGWPSCIHVISIGPRNAAGDNTIPAWRCAAVRSRLPRQRRRNSRFRARPAAAAKIRCRHTPSRWPPANAMLTRDPNEGPPKRGLNRCSCLFWSGREQAVGSCFPGRRFISLMGERLRSVRRQRSIAVLPRGRTCRSRGLRGPCGGERHRAS